MAEQNRSIFNEKATEKLRSVDNLDKYVRVPNPSGWAVIGATVALVLGLLAWGVFGAVSTNVNAWGVVVSDKDSGGLVIECFLAPNVASEVRAGDLASIAGNPTSVKEISEIPLSKEEVKEIVVDSYIYERVATQSWSFKVSLDTSTLDEDEFYKGTAYEVIISTERVSPLQAALGR